ncbi:WXG100 family type VII secretion target [Mycolicibacterium palauense]|uniref:WXG100 family type VII secretion target n=1 Tax=Mycolicibacterium palauense TaxID=2034511 RepID=UPI000BFEE3E8|nr:WXG100 family type VII secretion target [Mycolicibacterium palauense]
MALRVNIEDLIASGVAVTGHGEDVAMRHADADGRVEVAQGGWRGASAAALAAKSAAWLQTTGTLLTRMSDHAQGLHTSAQCFCEMEEGGSRALEIPAQAADAITAQTSP